MIDHSERMRTTSGLVNSDNPLSVFFYLLLRDHLLPGDLEMIMREVLDSSITDVQFTNGWLAEYAMYTASRLRSAERKTNG